MCQDANPNRLELTLNHRHLALHKWERHACVLLQASDCLLIGNSAWSCALHDGIGRELPLVHFLPFIGGVALALQG